MFKKSFLYFFLIIVEVYSNKSNDHITLLLKESYLKVIVSDSINTDSLDISLYKIYDFEGNYTNVDTTISVKKDYKMNFLRKDYFNTITSSNMGHFYNKLSRNLINESVYQKIGFNAKQEIYTNYNDINLDYAEQPSPDGLAQALIIAESFLNGSPSALILGDNLFYGYKLTSQIKKASLRKRGGTIFLYPVNDRERYGIATLDANGNIDMLIGVARTSTIEQVAGLEAQVKQLKEYGCEKIYQEQVSSVGEREQLNVALGSLRSGDKLVVTKLDRLARSVRHLGEIIDTVNEADAALVILDMGGTAIDTSNATGKLILNVMSSVSQFEREMMLERQREGIAKAKAEGKYKGRKPTARNKKDMVLMALKEGIKPASIMRELNISKTSYYRIVKEANL